MFLQELQSISHSKQETRCETPNVKICLLYYYLDQSSEALQYLKITYPNPFKMQNGLPNGIFEGKIIPFEVKYLLPSRSLSTN